MSGGTLILLFVGALALPILLGKKLAKYFPEYDKPIAGGWLGMFAMLIIFILVVGMVVWVPHKILNYFFMGLGFCYLVLFVVDCLGLKEVKTQWPWENLFTTLFFVLLYNALDWLGYLTIFGIAAASLIPLILLCWLVFGVFSALSKLKRRKAAKMLNQDLIASEQSQQS